MCVCGGAIGVLILILLEPGTDPERAKELPKGTQHLAVQMARPSRMDLHRVGGLPSLASILAVTTLVPTLPEPWAGTFDS